jgi:predicted alpha/beta-fold hydrolase
MKHIHEKYPEAPVYMVGYSMGAIQSMMWLSKNRGRQDFVKGFVSLSCPIDLSKASPRLSQYQHYIYAWWMTSALKKIAHYHRDLVESKGIHIDYSSHLLARKN